MAAGRCASAHVDRGDIAPCPAVAWSFVRRAEGRGGSVEGAARSSRDDPEEFLNRELRRSVGQEESVGLLTGVHELRVAEPYDLGAGTERVEERLQPGGVLL